MSKYIESLESTLILVPELTSLRAKLAIAVEALELIARAHFVSCFDDTGCMAQEALQKIRGDGTKGMKE